MYDISVYPFLYGFFLNHNRPFNVNVYNNFIELSNFYTITYRWETASTAVTVLNIVYIYI